METAVTGFPAKCPAVFVLVMVEVDVEVDVCTERTVAEGGVLSGEA